MIDLYALTRPLLFKIKPEMAHNLMIKTMKTGLMLPCSKVNDPALEVNLWGHKFPNPLGMAAGFDKNAEVIGALLNLGFGFVETGTVTPKPQHGNPKPRIFRCASHEAIINHMGFPGVGMNVFKDNLTKYLGNPKKHYGVVGINIGINKTQKHPAKDYAMLIKMLGSMADFLAVNISSPNTPGLRDLQKREPLLDLLGEIKEARKKACGEHPPPILVKLAPDLDEEQQEELAKTLMDAEIDGVILTNTTLNRPEALPQEFTKKQGGLSGLPLTHQSTKIIRNFYKLTNGKLPIIGVGGISTARDAYEKIKAGASLVQIYSSFVFKGPFVAHSINQGLLELLKADQLTNISEAVGQSVNLGKQGSQATNGKL
ncbi:MAG: quinone-dependent dihydroorotate dehydrogenase [Alphaproteobacteria bacterium]|nr:quinone-dependent dihydroorotate dehydrogenase [Alphaproteobacteria bacterium]